MTKKIVSWLSFMTVFLLTLQSCVHDEIYSSSDPASKEYHSKSLWKEDEIYIKNIIKIYEEHENEIRKGHGNPVWEYAMTMDKSDESYLVVPIRQNGKISEVLEVPRFGRKVYFRYSNDVEKVGLFNQLMIDRPKKPLPTNSANETSKIVCVVKTFSMWYPDSESNPNGSGHWVTSSYTICTDLTIDTFENPDDGSGNGGYDYPPFGSGGPDNPVDTTTVPKNPCEKLKTQNNDATFKSKIDYLKSKTGESFEYGFRVNNPPPGQTSTQYQQLSNVVGSNTIDFKFFNTTYGYMHSHFEKLIPIFSPDDINTFIKLLINAHNNNIPQENVFMNVVNPDGTIYQLRGEGINVGSLTIYDQNIIDNVLNKTYTNEYDLAKANQSPEFYQKNFLKFMRDKMNISGAKMFSVDSNGNSSQLLLNGNSLGNLIPCPN